VAPQPPGLVRTVLALLFVVGLIAASAWILYPFLSAVIWATLLVVSTWPLMRQVQARLWGRRTPAVLVMTALVLVVVIAPVALAVSTIFQHVDQLVDRVQTGRLLSVPPPPEWAHALPLVGENLSRQ